MIMHKTPVHLLAGQLSTRVVEKGVQVKTVTDRRLFSPELIVSAENLPPGGLMQNLCTCIKPEVLSPEADLGPRSSMHTHNGTEKISGLATQFSFEQYEPWTEPQVNLSLLRFTWRWAEVLSVAHIVQILNWVAWPRSSSLNHFCIHVNTRKQNDKKIPPQFLVHAPGLVTCQSWNF